MAVIFLKSTCRSEQDRALRMTVFIPLNVVRANADAMSHRLILYINDMRKSIESKFSKESNDYKNAIETLFSWVNRKLLTIVASTKILYFRGLDFKSDGSMLNKNYGICGMTEIITFYDDFIWKHSELSRLDIRLINRHEKNDLSENLILQEDFYALKANTLFLQSIISYLNVVSKKLCTLINEKPDSTDWIHIQMLIKDLEMTIECTKCSALGNKILILTTFTYLSVSEIPNVGNQLVDKIKLTDQISADIISMMGRHSVDICYTFIEVDNYLGKHIKVVVNSIPYKPGASDDDVDNSIQNENPDKGTPVYNVTPTGYVTPIKQSTVSHDTDNTNGDGDVEITGNSFSTVKSKTSQTRFETSKTYIGVIEEKQVTEILLNFERSVTQRITRVTIINSQPKNKHYEDVITIIIKSSQKTFQCNFDYLNIMTTKTVEYINKCTSPKSTEYNNAIVSLYKDIDEKKSCLLSYIEIIIRRLNNYSPTDEVTEYSIVMQIFDYGSFVKNFFLFFEIEYCKDDKKDFDVVLYIEYCLKIFIELYEKVKNELDKTPDEEYKKFLMCQLESTLEVYQSTCKIFKEEVNQILPIINKLGGNSLQIYSLECKQRMEAIISIYVTVFTVCHTYSQNTRSVNIQVSDYEILITKTKITTYYFSNIVKSEQQQKTSLDSSKVVYLQAEVTSS